MWKKSDILESVEKLKAEGYSDLASLVMAKAGVDSKEKYHQSTEAAPKHCAAQNRKAGGTL